MTPEIALIFSALSSSALAIFAGVQVWRQARQESEAQKAAAARIRATGFLVRRQIRSWLGQGADDFEAWIRGGNPLSVAKHLDEAEARVVAMLALAPDSPVTISEAVRTASIHFFNGSEKLNEYWRTPRPEGTIAMMDWMSLRDMAWHDFRDCIRVLEDEAGVQELLTESRNLDAKRRSQLPSVETQFKRAVQPALEVPNEEE